MQTMSDLIKVLADTFASLNRHIRIKFQLNFILDAVPVKYVSTAFMQIPELHSVKKYKKRK